MNYSYLKNRIRIPTINFRNYMEETQNIEDIKVLYIENLVFNQLNNILNNLLKNSSLVEINIRDNELDEYKLRLLSQIVDNNPNLKKLSLINDSINEIGSKIIANIISNNKSITDLNLTRNLINNQGLADILNALDNNCTIEHLSLASNINITFEGIEYLVKNLSDNQCLLKIVLGG